MPVPVPVSNKASLSRKIAAATPPRRVHALQQQRASVLSLATDGRYIYSGSQSADISVWDSFSFDLKTTLRGHTGSVLALEPATDRNWLFSSSGDSTIRVWCTRSHKPLLVLNPYLDTDAGDLFSLAWSPALQTIYVGCQNTSLQWYNFPPPTSTDAPGTPLPSGASTPNIRPAHKFFDSFPRSLRRTATSQLSRDGSGSASNESEPTAVQTIDIPAENVIDSAHYGYIYCMALLPSSREGSDDVSPRADGETYLVTGSGDEAIKAWRLTPFGPEFVAECECSHGAVLSLAACGDTVYAGCQDGYVKVWDLQTRTLMRTIIVQEGIDVLSLSVLGTDVYACSADGQVSCFSDTFDCSAAWRGHDGIALSSIVARQRQTHEYLLVTGGNDGAINFWGVQRGGLTSALSCPDDIIRGECKDDLFFYALNKFVSIPSVSSAPEHREDCRQAAVWLSKCMQQLGAPSKILSTGDDTNPIVLATFHGACPSTATRNPRILVYGHYDVISAPPENWDSPPFTLTARNGSMYGRGVSDDKGPVLAMACAAAELLQSRRLNVDVLFLIEGEEETGSVGFRATVEKYKEHIGHVDAILVSNSSWIAPNVPSITYGLRGVVHCNLQITADNRPDLHSGVYGGGVQEPMMDMIQLLAALQDRDRRVQIPGFYDNVRTQDKKEAELFRMLEEITQTCSSKLCSRWCEPSLTVHNIAGSGPTNSTVISSSVSAQVSIRIVPDQDLDTITAQLCSFIRETFAGMNSAHKLSVSVDHAADWWLGELEHPWFLALESAIRDEWGVQPMRVREGGTIPCVPFLEKSFGCPALHLPMGSGADQAHLPNEHLALSHLRHGKSVVKRFLERVGEGGVLDQ
ncbi:Zn-dependent exopeptidase [Peniophora sp. CONT]|nr:Zn-dependent exopeptidase [Peniophora sp. CONT]